MTATACYSFFDVPNLAGKCVLVVDDDQAQREVVQEILELEGVRVLNARTSTEAARLLDQAPDVVLLDLHGVEGEELVPRIRGLPNPPSILVLSGDVKLAQEAQKLGADGWLGKPYDLDDLLGLVAKVIESRGAVQQGVSP